MGRISVYIQERKNEIISLLKDKEYRESFVEASINIGVPSQIRALRKQRQWSQEKLAEEAIMQQEGVSRLEDSTRGSVNIKTLLRLASAFNVGLMVRFVPFSEMVDWKLRLSLESLEVEGFDQEIYFQENNKEKDYIAGNKQYTEVLKQEASGKVLYIKLDQLAQKVGNPPNEQILKSMSA